MINKFEYMLREFGKDYIRQHEAANEYGENILHGAGLLQGRVQDASSSGHKILCPECSPTTQRVRIAVNRLPLPQRMAIQGWYGTPLHEGQPRTQAYVATSVRMTLPAFRDNLRKARRELRRVLL